MPYIILTANGEELQRAALDGPTIIGRSPECDVSVRDILLSRRHCRLEPGTAKEGGRWKLIDLGSRNGSHVNWKKITQYTLVDGDVVRIGRTWLTFRTGAFKEAPPGTPVAAASKSKMVRPADPHEALSGTVSDFVYVEPDVGGQDFDGTPSPRRRPAAPTEAAALKSPLSELSSSWDSIVVATTKPRPMARPIPRSIGAAIAMRREVDLSLQASPAHMPYLQVLPPRSKCRVDVVPAVVLSIGIMLATLMVLLSGWVMTR